MDPTPDPVGDALYGLGAEISRAEKVAPSEDELVDFCGQLANYTTRLRDLQKRHRSEIGGPRQGQAYRAVERRSARRTYNTQAILFEATRNQDLPSALNDLIESGAVRMQWQWTKLRDFLTRHNLPLHLVPRELSDGDLVAMVGEVWETKITIEGLEQ